jgi:hypothetical protein
VPSFGKTAWTESLETTDPTVAREKRARRVSECTAEILAARARVRNSASADAVALLDRAFSRQAETYGTMDRAIAAQLQMLASFVVESWAGSQAGDDEQWWGEFLVRSPATQHEPVPSLDTDGERALYRLRADLVEGRGLADGLVHQELAAILLERRVFQPVWAVVSYMRSIEPQLPLKPEPVYDAVAESYLRRLAEHRFESWPVNVREALAPLGRGTPPPTGTASITPPEVVRQHEGLRAKRLTEALAYWAEQRRPRQSAVNEASRAVARYVALFGDVAVGDIMRAQVIDFRNLVADLPPQMELAKLVAAGRTLRSEIDRAREVRLAWQAGDQKGPELGRLAPGSVKKDVGAISQILGAIQADLGDGVNVAAGIQIAGYIKTRQGQQRPHLPFTPAMMQRLFDSPLFTGCAGETEMERTQPGPHIYQECRRRGRSSSQATAQGHGGVLREIAADHHRDRGVRRFAPLGATPHFIRSRGEADRGAVGEAVCEARQERRG